MLCACGIGSSPTGDGGVAEARTADEGPNDPLRRRARLAGTIEADGTVDLAGIDEEIARIRDTLIVDRYLEALYAEAVDERSIEAHYREHADDFRQRTVRLAHILLRVPPAATDTARAAALTRAQALLARLRLGETFADVAAAESEDESSAARGGELGQVSEHDIVEPVMAAALALDPDEVSDPIVTSYGIHLVKVLGPVRERARPLAEVRAGIVRTLRTQAKREAFAALGVNERADIDDGRTDIAERDR